MDPSQLSLADVNHHAEESYLNTSSGETDNNFSLDVDNNNATTADIDYSFMPTFDDAAGALTNAPMLNQGFGPPQATDESNIAFPATMSLNPALPLNDPTTVATNVPPTSQSVNGRYLCSACGKDFGRRGDMEHHAKKHSSTVIPCPVQGCEYKGHYRKDKVNQHIKNRHPGIGRI